jgi:hypothetical protein
VIELKPVALDDSGIIFHAWGRHPENFAYLTAPTFTGLDDAKRYIAKLFQTPDSKAFHIIDPTVGVVGLVKAGYSSTAPKLATLSIVPSGEEDSQRKRRVR